MVSAFHIERQVHLDAMRVMIVFSLLGNNTDSDDDEKVLNSFVCV